MAGQYVSIVMTGMQGVYPTAKLVALVLADCANLKHNGIAYPSIAAIVERTGLCERQVQTHLRELVAAGWLEAVGTTHGGRGMATRYRLNLIRMRAADAIKGAAGRTHTAPPKGAVHRTHTEAVNGAAHRTLNDALKGAVSNIKGCSFEQKRVQPTAPEPEGTVIDRGKVTPPEGAIDSLRKALIKSTAEPENGAPPKVDDQPALSYKPKPPKRSQAEQIAYVQHLLATKGNH